MARAAVSLTNQSIIDVAADGGGSIAVNAGELEILGSFLSAGIGSDSGFRGAQAGDITLNASTIRGGEAAFIANLVGIGGVGNGGDIRITAADSLLLTDVSQVRTTTLGQGNAGSVTINARDLVSLDSSAILSIVESRNLNGIAVGNGGDIRITTGSLALTNGAVVSASTFGEGNAGNVIINARDRVSLVGETSKDSRVLSLATSAVSPRARLPWATAAISISLQAPSC